LVSNTEEALRARVYGLTARGAPADGPLNRRTGTGWVKSSTGDYADALSKGHGVLMLGMESTGALFTPFVLMLKTLGKLSTAPGTHDSTIYGTARASPQTFFRHHVAAISSAVVLADALSVLNSAATMSFKLTQGIFA
jgi:hypothetical protein